jgi:DNA-binding transcriptional ArsR family regulator
LTSTKKAEVVRMAPSNQEAEKGVLGAVLLDDSAFLRLTGLLQPRDFYCQAHRKIFSAFSSLAAQKIPIDLVTATSELRRAEALEQCGGAEYLASLTDGIAGAMNVEHYAQEIRETADRRGIIEISNELLTRSYENSASAVELLRDARHRFSELTNQSQRRPNSEQWKLWDAADMNSWPASPLEWHVENLIPKRGIGFVSAPPKTAKTLLTVDLALHLTNPAPQRRRFLDRFAVNPAKVLYIAREDPMRRIQERVFEIAKSYEMAIPPPNHLQFQIRDRIALTDPIYLEWLKDRIQEHQSEVVVLDVLNRMIPDLDESSAKDMAKMVSILEELNREMRVTIIVLDHTRKPQGDNRRRDSQEPNPFDLKGSIAKYGCADFMLCLARTPHPSRLIVYSESKDTDERPTFLLDVSPKDSGKPKFSWAGDVAKLATDMKALGDENQEKIFKAFQPGVWANAKDIATKLNLSRSTVNKHILALFDARRLERTGSGRNTAYKLLPTEGQELPWEKSVN